MTSDSCRRTSATAMRLPRRCFIDNEMTQNINRIVRRMGRKGTCMYGRQWKDRNGGIRRVITWDGYDQNNEAKFDKDQAKEKLKRNYHSRVLNTVTNQRANTRTIYATSMMMQLIYIQYETKFSP